MIGPCSCPCTTNGPKTRAQVSFVVDGAFALREPRTFAEREESVARSLFLTREKERKNTRVSNSTPLSRPFSRWPTGPRSGRRPISIDACCVSQVSRSCPKVLHLDDGESVRKRDETARVVRALDRPHARHQSTTTASKFTVNIAWRVLGLGTACCRLWSRAR